MLKKIVNTNKIQTERGQTLCNMNFKLCEKTLKNKNVTI